MRLKHCFTRFWISHNLIRWVSLTHKNVIKFKFKLRTIPLLKKRNVGETVSEHPRVPLMNLRLKNFNHILIGRPVRLWFSNRFGALGGRCGHILSVARYFWDQRDRRCPERRFTLIGGSRRSKKPLESNIERFAANWVTNNFICMNLVASCGGRYSTNTSFGVWSDLLFLCTFYGKTEEYRYV